MPKEFVIVVANNRKLGEILIPYVIDRKSGQSFFQLQEIVTVDNYKNLSIHFSESDIQFIKTASEYSDKTIFKLFSKKKNLKEFFDTVDDALLTQQIRPYIEKKLLKCFDILCESEVPLYRKEKNYQVVHDDERIRLEKVPAQPVFNFIKTDVDFKYFLSIRHNEKDIKLYNQSVTIISQKPCIFVLNGKLYQVTNIDSKKLLPFFTKDFITVPRNSEREYLETFVKNAILNYPVKAVGFTISDIEPVKKAALSLEPNLKSEPVFILKFLYNTQEFHFQSPNLSCVSLVHNENRYVYEKITRDLNWENSMALKLASFGFENTEGPVFRMKSLEGDAGWQFYEMISWLNFNHHKLEEIGFDQIKSKADKDYYLKNIDLDLKLNDDKDWFDLKAKVKLGDFVFPFSRFRKHIMMGIREFTLPNNQVVILPTEWFSRYRELFTFGNEENEDSLRIKKHHFRVLQEALGGSISEILIKFSDKMDSAKAEQFQEPEELKAVLREYQKVGVHWMFQLYKNNFGGCLADDMGLGKTLQTITLLLKVKEDSRGTAVIPELKKPNSQLSLFDIPEFTGGRSLQTSLIIMPVSLIHNWENEINKFAPSLKIYKFFGTQRTRNYAELLNVDIVLASYGVIRNDADYLQDLNFKYIILDESQAIKNPDSKIYKAVTQLQSEYKMVLTGTPIENSLTDLWAQLNFINRDLLKSQHYFREEFVVPIEKYNDDQKKRKLQAIINPFILRRKKEEVVKELPSLSEQMLYCDMTDEQQKVYESEKSMVRNLILDNIASQGFEKSAIVILKALNKLRLLANHPVLAEPDYKGESGKFDEIIRRIETVVEEKHKVLIFSSYVKHLNIVANHLTCREWPYVMLTGSTHNRAEVIRQFQNEEDKRVFLISLKAGGTGLNLTAADYVFILDPWWNPASENQAISRAHRIGQDKKVFVYRFISRNTIEEKIQLLQQRKSAMAELFINSNNPFKSFNKEEIVELFK